MKTKKRGAGLLAAKVLRARTAMLWTQADLSAAADVSPSLIANIERGCTRTASPLTLAKLGQALNLNLSRHIKRAAPRETR